MNNLFTPLLIFGCIFGCIFGLIYGISGIIFLPSGKITKCDEYDDVNPIIILPNGTYLRKRNVMYKPLRPKI